MNEIEQLKDIKKERVNITNVMTALQLFNVINDNKDFEGKTVLVRCETLSSADLLSVIDSFALKFSDLLEEGDTEYVFLDNLSKMIVDEFLKPTEFLSKIEKKIKNKRVTILTNIWSSINDER